MKLRLSQVKGAWVRGLCTGTQPSVLGMTGRLWVVCRGPTIVFRYEPAVPYKNVKMNEPLLVSKNHRQVKYHLFLAKGQKKT